MTQRIEQLEQRKAVASVIQLHAADPTDREDPWERGQVPISDLDAEGSVLSSLLNDFPAGCWSKVGTILRAEMLYAHCNQRVFEAIEALHAAGKLVDVVTVMRFMRERGTLTQSGGSPYLSQLLDTQPACAHPEVHADSIRELWRERCLADEMGRIVIELRNGQLDHAGARARLSAHFKVTR